ncbi:MAG: IS1595 family transposase [Bryobacteraceae bacterium]|jgi:transposase-like protein
MREFPDDDACLMYIFEQRWSGGIARCEKCEKETKHHRVTGRTAFACDRCGWHIYPLAGTIFEKSSTSLQKWLHAMYQMGSSRCRISAKQIQRETSVTYKTAWRMFKKIRPIMSDGDVQLEGEVDTSKLARADAGACTHRRIHHASKVCVMGDIHINTVEGFWSL